MAARPADGAKSHHRAPFCPWPSLSPSLAGVLRLTQQLGHLTPARRCMRSEIVAPGCVWLPVFKALCDTWVNPSCAGAPSRLGRRAETECSGDLPSTPRAIAPRRGLLCLTAQRWADSYCEAGGSWHCPLATQACVGCRVEVLVPSTQALHLQGRCPSFQVSSAPCPPPTPTCKGCVHTCLFL